jgi:hypothetical protein
MHHIQHTLVTETAATPFINVAFPTEQCESPVCGLVGDTTGLHHLSMNFPNNCYHAMSPLSEGFSADKNMKSFFIKIIT